MNSCVPLGVRSHAYLSAGFPLRNMLYVPAQNIQSKQRNGVVTRLY